MESTFGEYSMLLQELCSQMPMCHLSEGDLIKTPEFTKLLLEISKHVDDSGLSMNLRSDLDMAQNGLRLQKKTWLECEVVKQLLQEMLQEYHCKNGLNKEKKDWQEMPGSKTEYCDTLNQCMLVAECTRLLDLSPNPGENMELLLGLNKEELREFLPPKQDVQKMKDWLQTELEKRLNKKCIGILSFHKSSSDSSSDSQRGDSERLKSMKALQLVSTLQAEKRQLESEIQKGHQTVAMIDQQKIFLPPVLLQCLSLLQKMASEFRLLARSDIDRHNTEYMKTKCNAVFLKIRMEEQQVLLDTYTPQKLEVHKVIRDSLLKALNTQEQEIEISRMLLKTYENPGPRYQKILEEYTKFKKDIASHKWALAELSKSS